MLFLLWITAQTSQSGRTLHAQPQRKRWLDKNVTNPCILDVFIIEIKTDFFVEFRKIFFCLFHMFLLSKFNNVHGQWTQWQHETNSIHINRKNFEEHRCMSIISSWHKSRLAGNTYKIQNLHTILVHVVNNKQQCACINQMWSISL